MSANPSLYRITINGAGGAAPTDGFLDRTRAETYLANSTYGADGVYPPSLDNLPAAFTLTTSLAKKRANIRYHAMVAQLGFVGNMHVSNYNATGANAITAASSLTFDLYVEHGDSSLVTWDETANGTQITYPPAVLARAISRALIQNVVVQADVLDPTANTSVGVLAASKSVPRYGTRLQSITVGPVYTTLTTANAAITVTPLYQPVT